MTLTETNVNLILQLCGNGNAKKTSNNLNYTHQIKITFGKDTKKFTMMFNYNKKAVLHFLIQKMKDIKLNNSTPVKYKLFLNYLNSDFFQIKSTFPKLMYYT